MIVSLVAWRAVARTATRGPPTSPRGITTAVSHIPESRKIYSARVIERMAETHERGYPKSPSMIENELLSNDDRTLAENYFKSDKANLSNNSIQYRLNGSLNGTDGTFELFTRPSTSGRTELIMHEFFRRAR